MSVCFVRRESEKVCLSQEHVHVVTITIASPQIYTTRPVKVKVVTVRRNGQPPLGVAASRP